MMAWEPEQRRVGSYVVLGVALALVLGGVAAWFFLASTPEWVYWTLVGALALVLVFMLVLLFVQPKAKAVEAAPAEAAAAPVAEEAAAPAQAFEPRILTLRCGDCGTIFDVTDTGERPLYHTCPGCGAEGALRDPVDAPPAPAEPAPETYAPPAEYAPPPPPPPAPTESAPAEASAEAPPQPPVKKLKLRCGGCKEVFTIEDTGERPLKRACPHCGRIGKIG